MKTVNQLETAALSVEWPKALELASNHVLSEPAFHFLTSLADSGNWAQTPEQAKILQSMTSEIIPLLDREALWNPLRDLASPGEIIEKLKKGAVLSIENFFLILHWLDAFHEWSDIPIDELKSEKIKKSIQCLFDLRTPQSSIQKILTPDGNLKETATPEIATLFSDLRNLRREIQSKLDQLIKGYNASGQLQDAYSDVRDGRYVLPVKISNQNDIEGIIHDVSVSKQTVFIEPHSISILNNKIRQKQSDLDQAIFILLSKISKELSQFIGQIENNISILVHWDTIQARARFGQIYGGKPIQIETASKSFSLKGAAHPLLWYTLKPEQITRNDLIFHGPCLLISGPNTGGKTVLLKMLGLAIIFARNGFLFPAQESPKIPFFNSLFSDLGDPQSIESHLSSFSGHIVKFKEMLEQVTQDSLILIDELNTATDPEEGSALSRAILETLIEKNAFVVATTHDTYLKAIAQKDSRIQNASMLFDDTSKLPTYKLILGVAGRSRAIETAKRLGLSDTLILKAKTYLSQHHNDLENILSTLEVETHQAVRLRKEAGELEQEANRLEKQWREKTQKEFGELSERYRQRLRRVFEEAQDDVKRLLQKIEEAKAPKEIEQARQNLSLSFSKSTDAVSKALEIEAPEIAKEISQNLPTVTVEQYEFKTGDHVKVPKFKATATVLEVHPNKLKIALGNLQIFVSTNEVEKTKQPQGHWLKTKGVGYTAADISESSNRLDLRGKRFEEAMSELSAFLDLSFRSQSHLEVTIVHGLGTGVLREGTIKLLKKLPYVKSFRDGGSGSGGSGATIVEFEF